jgi:hypothetical protein
MAYLLDTNVVSELRKRKPHGAVMEWIEKLPAESLRLSAVTLGEIQAGIERTRELNPIKAQELEAWLDDLASTTSIIDVDAAVVHDLTVASRNVTDFKAFGVKLVNPFA